MISHRVADNQLDPVKDDLLLALRRIELDLDSYHEEPRDPAPLEAIVEAISQIRGPLVVLDHREAVTFLDEVRALVQSGWRERSRRSTRCCCSRPPSTWRTI